MKTIKILIVDDEPNILMALEYAFKKNNFEVYIARDGEEALQIAAKKIPDIVILDIMMPQMDGYETLRQLHAMPNLEQVKTVFLSAKNKATDLEKGLDLGVDMYLFKPFSIKKIIQDITELAAK